jgi:uncharacterized membrane protein YkvA (DUF1232 family)
MAFARSAFWNRWSDKDRAEHNEATVRHGFWGKARRVAAKLPFAEDLLTAYYCALDSETPTHVKAALFGALAYFVLPFDAVSDLLPLLGFVDDAAVLATALRMVATELKPEHRAAAKRALEKGLGS